MWMGILIWSVACDRPFSYSPFEAAVPNNLRNTTHKNLQRIQAAEKNTPDTFKVALLADPHYHFNDMDAAISKINRDSSIAFIIVAGDLTENGLLKEFEIFYRMMSNARVPYLTVIGNHDHLSNGKVIYQQFYGPRNYSFTFKGVKFIMWDNVMWESNESPDWNWFRSELGSQGENKLFRHTLPFSHIPPSDGQLEDSANVFHRLLVENNIPISVHGHKHEYSKEELYGDGIQYVTIGSPVKRSYVVLTITPDSVSAHKVTF
jgi:3',5'-cyclic-AMP phosphodiesterase